MKTQRITTIYEEEKCPLRKDGTLAIDSDSQPGYLNPEDFKVIVNEFNTEACEGELEIEIPYLSNCRFLEWQDGWPPECWGFGNAGMERMSPVSMEHALSGCAPEGFCYWCHIYPGEYEARIMGSGEVADEHGVTWLLPELMESEVYDVERLDFVCRDATLSMLQIRNCPIGATNFDELLAMIADGRHDIDLIHFERAKGLQSGWNWSEIEITEKFTANDLDNLLHRGLSACEYTDDWRFAGLTAEADRR